MSVTRRSFLSNATLLCSSLFLGDQLLKPAKKPSFAIPANFSLKVMATNWGFAGSFDEFCAKAKATGYDGIEVWLPGNEADRDALFNAIDKHGLAFGFLAGSGESDFQKHYDQFQKAVETAASFKPLYVNCHSGRDYFTFDQAKSIINYTTRYSQSSGVKIYHETHRSRILFAAHVARTFIEALPDLRLTLDISHWCNVHESLLADQQETVALALSRTDHIHTRVGHAESPQITDPRAPEWKNAVDAHFAWWDQVVKNKIDRGEVLTMTAEFGPPDYMATVPFTHQPLVDLWDVNAYMLQTCKERYASG